MEKSVLFVCSGNTCRSPLAEVWFNKCAAAAGLTGYKAGSPSPAAGHRPTAGQWQQQMDCRWMISGAELLLMKWSARPN